MTGLCLALINKISIYLSIFFQRQITFSFFSPIIWLFYKFRGVLHYMLQVLSRPSGFFLKPVANMLSISDSGANLLSFKRKDLVWVCNLHIFLSQSNNNFFQLKNDLGCIYFYMISIIDYSSVLFSYGNICIVCLRFAPRLQM